MWDVLRVTLPITVFFSMLKLVMTNSHKEKMLSKDFQFLFARDLFSCNVDLNI